MKIRNSKKPKVMKNKVFILSTLIFNFLLLKIYSQVTICEIKYSYDNNGNRIKRKHVCYIDDQNGNREAALSNIESEKQKEVKEENFINAKLYPNPTSGLVNLQITNEIKGNFNLLIFDLSGKLISSYNVTNGLNQLDISNLVNGNYVATVKINNQDFDWQIIKKSN